MTQVLEKPGVDSSRQEVLKLYGNRLRLRVCGLYREGDRLLMVRHRGIGITDTFWCPPGGGAQFGETAPDALVREFSEETGLEVKIGDLLFVNEFMQPPLHAMELFFEVQATGGTLRLGSDPEMGLDEQIIEDVQLMSFDEIKSYPPEEVHTLFQHCNSLDDVFQLRGYLHP
ncbi:NUDIX domain-containing protein [Spirosoma soli]|uniref:NUDIX domain-containing protein n=1 Tax=Spirosoma soli TaxID=1770529 RepID=A0ABW5LZW9_9BACT